MYSIKDAATLNHSRILYRFLFWVWICCVCLLFLFVFFSLDRYSIDRKEELFSEIFRWHNHHKTKHIDFSFSEEEKKKLLNSTNKDSLLYTNYKRDHTTMGSNGKPKWNIDEFTMRLPAIAKSNKLYTIFFSSFSSHWHQVSTKWNNMFTTHTFLFRFPIFFFIRLSFQMEKYLIYASHTQSYWPNISIGDIYWNE